MLPALCRDMSHRLRKFTRSGCAAAKSGHLCTLSPLPQVLPWSHPQQHPLCRFLCYLPVLHSLHVSTADSTAVWFAMLIAVPHSKRTISRARGGDGVQVAAISLLRAALPMVKTSSPFF